jgi:hypothetical protein
MGAELILTRRTSYARPIIFIWNPPDGRWQALAQRPRLTSRLLQAAGGEVPVYLTGIGLPGAAMEGNNA